MAHLALLLIPLARGADYTLTDLAPETSAHPVLVVVTPGFELDGYLPLVRALRDVGRDVHVLRFACAGQDARRLQDELVAAAATLPDQKAIVAHGLGATLALQAADRLKAERYVLLAPVLDVEPVAAVSFAAAHVPETDAIDLARAVAWGGGDLADTLLGARHPALGCVPGPFAREALGWAAAREVPIALESVAVPVWIAVSLGDDVAAIEVVVPASRRLPDRTLVRLGMNHLDDQDYDHGELLTAPVPIRAAVDAVTRRRLGER